MVGNLLTDLRNSREVVGGIMRERERDVRNAQLVVIKNPSCPGIAELILQGVDGIPKYSHSVH